MAISSPNNRGATQANALDVSCVMFHGMLYPTVCEGVVWRLESLSEQVHAICSCSLLTIFPPRRRESRSSVGMLAPVNAAACTQALLACPATHTAYSVFSAPHHHRPALYLQSCYMNLYPGKSSDLHRRVARGHQESNAECIRTDKLMRQALERAGQGLRGCL